MTDPFDRVQTLFLKATDPASGDEEKRTSAVIMCKMMKEHGFKIVRGADAPRDNSRRAPGGPPPGSGPFGGDPFGGMPGDFGDFFRDVYARAREREEAARKEAQRRREQEEAERRRRQASPGPDSYSWRAGSAGFDPGQGPRSGPWWGDARGPGPDNHREAKSKGERDRREPRDPDSSRNQANWTHAEIKEGRGKPGQWCKVCGKEFLTDERINVRPPFGSWCWTCPPPAAARQDHAPQRPPGDPDAPPFGSAGCNCFHTVVTPDASKPGESNWATRPECPVHGAKAYETRKARKAKKTANRSAHAAGEPPSYVQDTPRHPDNMRYKQIAHMAAQFRGYCKSCKKTIMPGWWINYRKGVGAWHSACPPPAGVDLGPERGAPGEPPADDGDFDVGDLPDQY